MEQMEQMEQPGLLNLHTGNPSLSAVEGRSCGVRETQARRDPVMEDTASRRASDDVPTRRAQLPPGVAGCERYASCQECWAALAEPIEQVEVEQVEQRAGAPTRERASAEQSEQVEQVEQRAGAPTRAGN